jgi:hypothetical protein
MDRILSGESDTNIPFDRTRSMLLYLGFEESVKATSHHKFRRDDIDDLINLQEREGGKCVAYQVKQLRETAKKYNLRAEL